jgi:hypothetical protein
MDQSIFDTLQIQQFEPYGFEYMVNSIVPQTYDPDENYDIEIYCEYHNNPYFMTQTKLPNQIIDSLSRVEEKPLILLEHPEKYCDYSKLNTEYKKNLKIYSQKSAIEYMFLNLSEKKYDNFKCIDNREYLQFSNRLEEKFLFDTIDSMKETKSIEILITIMPVIAQMAINITGDNSKDFFLKEKVIDSYKIKYSVFIEAIKNQYNIIVLIFSLHTEIFKPIDEDMRDQILPEIITYFDYFVHTITKLANNIINLQNLAIDINIMNNILESKSTYIKLFCGTSHGIRIIENFLNHPEGETRIKDHVGKDITSFSQSFIPEETYQKANIIHIVEDNEPMFITHLESKLEYIKQVKDYKKTSSRRKRKRNSSKKNKKKSRSRNKTKTRTRTRTKTKTRRRRY